MANWPVVRSLAGVASYNAWLKGAILLVMCACGVFVDSGSASLVVDVKCGVIRLVVVGEAESNTTVSNLLGEFTSLGGAFVSNRASSCPKLIFTM